MPWNGGDGHPGEFPTLGYLVADWIEAYLIIPDGMRRGEPFILTDEQYRHLLWTYRLRPNARADMGSQAFVFYGSLLVRPQKAGKDPSAAAEVCAQGLGPVRFDGWDANGEPVGKPMPTPLIQCAANSEDQVANTFDPIVAMLGEGPLNGTPGLDVGLTRVNLPNAGRIEPVTAAAKSRLGARITYATFTESGLYTESSGGMAMARTMKRGLAGMDGRWKELTNAWNPAEYSVAQMTYEAKAPGVYIDYRPPRTRVDLDDDAALRNELAYVYGDSAIEAGGWVRLERIMDEARDPSTGEGEARRFFLNEVTVGSKDAIDPIKWAKQSKPDEEPLKPKDVIALGFHGSATREATSLCASRIRDGKLFHLRSWEKPAHVTAEAWSVPRAEVHEAVHDAFEAYTVTILMASPSTWQDEVNVWEGKYPKQVLEIWLNSEMRMDQIVERFMTAHRGDDHLKHDGSDTLTKHALASALANGKRRPSGEDRVAGQSEFYQRVVKKSAAQSISAFFAALLANEARGWAIEHGLDIIPGAPTLWL